MKGKAKLFTAGLAISMDDMSPIQSIAEDAAVYDEDRNLIGRVVKATQQPDGSVTVEIEWQNDANILLQQAREMLAGSIRIKKEGEPKPAPNESL